MPSPLKISRALARKHTQKTGLWLTRLPAILSITRSLVGLGNHQIPSRPVLGLGGCLIVAAALSKLAAPFHDHTDCLAPPDKGRVVSIDIGQFAVHQIADHALSRLSSRVYELLDAFCEMRLHGRCCSHQPEQILETFAEEWKKIKGSTLQQYRTSTIQPAMLRNRILADLSTKMRRVYRNCRWHCHLIMISISYTADGSETTIGSHINQPGGRYEIKAVKVWYRHDIFPSVRIVLKIIGQNSARNVCSGIRKRSD